MKNLSSKFPILAFILIAVICSCDKDTEVISTFPFAITEIHPDSTTINFPQLTAFKITPERVVKSNTYTFSYEVLNGNGGYLDTEGNSIPPETPVSLEGLNPKLLFSSSKIGDEKIRVTIQDNGAVSETLDLEYKIVHNPYSVNLTTPVNTAKVNETKPVGLSLFNLGEDKDVTYERAFYIVQGNGTLKLPNSDEEIPLETFEPIEQGTFNYDISFSDFGESVVIVTTRDSNLQVKSDTLEFNIDPIDITFNAATEKNSAFVGEAFDINFDISEEQGQGGQYQMRYTVDEGTVSLFNGDVELSPGVLYNVNLGGFTWTAFGTETGTVELTFILKNEQGVEISRNIEVDIQDSGLVFDAVPIAAQASIGEELLFNANIVEDPEKSPPYILKFTTSSAGIISYNNVDYLPGESINIPNDEFSFYYIGSSEGNHDITFTLENDLGAFGEDSEQITVEIPDFSYASNSLDNFKNITENGMVNHTITSQGGEQTFKIRYNVIEGDIVLKQGNQVRNQGILYDISSGNSQWSLEPNAPGDIEIEFTVENNFGIQKTQTVNLTVLVPEFNITASSPNPILTVENDVDIDFDIDGTNDLDYFITYSISPNNGAVLKYNNNVLAQNTELNASQYSFKFDFNEAAAYTITFTVTSNYDTEKQAVSEVTVNNTPFNFNFSSPNGVVDISHVLSIALSGAASGFTLSGEVLQGSGNFGFQNGDGIGKGNNVPRQYTPTVDGNHNIRLTVTDGYGYSKSVEKQFTVSGNGPTITGINSTAYEKYSCNQLGFFKQCGLQIKSSLAIDNIFVIESYRTRFNNMVSAESPILFNFSVIIQAGGVVISNDNNVNDGAVTIPPNTPYEIQVKDANDQWSDWFQVQSPNAYNLTYN
ncbi:hypothetical protein HME9304_01798 [Flagellimonas maritima]|uniref:Uncharacterized protein n=1 Tax=Flagellimonas maritima TaxID=1383885 RepID=A0A2Z4LSI5_9FLAO|nr:TraQ conjugal transfer family protein [Allomuricauda aurantiaca]AWX44793.1 hypothetical protein HME9304_01798 [Allomuricauda aurantiaca]